MIKISSIWQYFCFDVRAVCPDTVYYHSRKKKRYWVAIRFVVKLKKWISHYGAILMSMMVSQITSLMIVNSTSLFRSRSKKTSKLHVAGLCAGNSAVTGEFPTQMANDTEKVSIWWCYHVRGIIYQFLAFIHVLIHYPIFLPIIFPLKYFFILSTMYNHAPYM